MAIGLAVDRGGGGVDEPPQTLVPECFQQALRGQDVSLHIMEEPLPEARPDARLGGKMEHHLDLAAQGGEIGLQ